MILLVSANRNAFDTGCTLVKNHHSQSHYEGQKSRDVNARRTPHHKLRPNFSEDPDLSSVDEMHEDDLYDEIDNGGDDDYEPYDISDECYDDDREPGSQNTIYQYFSMTLY